MAWWLVKILVSGNALMQCVPACAKADVYKRCYRNRSYMLSLKNMTPALSTATLRSVTPAWPPALTAGVGRRSTFHLRDLGGVNNTPLHAAKHWSGVDAAVLKYLEWKWEQELLWRVRGLSCLTRFGFVQSRPLQVWAGVTKRASDKCKADFVSPCPRPNLMEGLALTWL